MPRNRGFTLLEIALSLAVVGILVAIAYPFYRDYRARAKASELVLKYDAVKAGIGTDLAQGPVDSCAELASRVNPGNLKSEFARLGVEFEREGDAGYRAVLAYCADAKVEGETGLMVTREAHGVFEKTNRVEKSAVLNDTLVSYAIPLQASGAIACRTGAPQGKPMCSRGSGGGGTPPVTTPPVTTPPVTTPPVVNPPVLNPPVVNPPVVNPPVVNPPVVNPPVVNPPAVIPPVGQDPAACRANCRVLYPHGNGRAYRDCVAACG